MQKFKKDTVNIDTVKGKRVAGTLEKCLKREDVAENIVILNSITEKTRIQGWTGTFRKFLKDEDETPLVFVKGVSDDNLYDEQNRCYVFRIKERFSETFNIQIIIEEEELISLNENTLLRIKNRREII